MYVFKNNQRNNGWRAVRVVLHDDMGKSTAEFEFL